MYITSNLNPDNSKYSLCNSMQPRVLSLVERWIVGTSSTSSSSSSSHRSGDNRVYYGYNHWQPTETGRRRSRCSRWEEGSVWSSRETGITTNMLQGPMHGQERSINRSTDIYSREKQRGRREDGRGDEERRKGGSFIIIRTHSFARKNLTNPAENLVNSAAHRGKADEIPRLTAATQLNFRGLIKS